MEYIQKDLSTCIDTQKPGSLKEKLHLMLGIISGICYIHDHKIIHRDIKPQNILMADGNPVLIDFG
jgi:serine/threonine protein kinase